MCRCILAPVDGTAFGEQALPFAASLARRFGATLHLVHVHEPAVAPLGVEAGVFRGAWSELLKEQESGYLQGLAERAGRAYGVRVETWVLDGPVIDELEHCAMERGAGLVVMSTRGHTGLSRLWHHGVAEQVARDLPVPTLLVRPAREETVELGQEHAFRHILVPLDGTLQAEAMLRHATAIGRLFDAHYTLLRVVEEGAGPSLRHGAQERHHRQARGQLVARQYLSSVAERMRAVGLDARVQVVAAREPGSAIVEFARASAATTDPVDLIALECRPHGTVARLVTSHTGDVVLRGAPVPVLLLQDPAALAGKPAGAPPLPTPG